jgi:hypothetical protein
VILNFEFLLVLNHDDGTSDCPKREDLGKHEGLLDRQCGGSNNSYRYFVVKKSHILFLDKPQILLYCFDFISIEHGFCCNSKVVFF